MRACLLMWLMFMLKTSPQISSVAYKSLRSHYSSETSWYFLSVSSYIYTLSSSHTYCSHPYPHKPGELKGGYVFSNIQSNSHVTRPPWIFDIFQWFLFLNLQSSFIQDHNAPWPLLISCLSLYAVLMCFLTIYFLSLCWFCLVCPH